MSLRLNGSLTDVKSVEAVIALRRRGVPTLKAKRAVEAAMARDSCVLEVPMLEDKQALAEDLKKFGLAMSLVTALPVDVKQVRERLDLTQEQFAMRFGLELDAVRNWERGRREPDAAAKSYLAVIARHPEMVEEALLVPVA